MDKHTCKLCFRSFLNGRALDGHMRSHVTAAKAAELRQLQQEHQLHQVEEEEQRQQQVDYPSSPSASSTWSHEAVKDSGVTTAAMAADGYVLRENPKKSFRIVDPEFSLTLTAAMAISAAAVNTGAGCSSSIFVQDRESDNECLRPISQRRQRSKRRRRNSSVPPPPQPPAASDPQPPLSSVSDTTPEEDVALSLVMLSCDAWFVKQSVEDQQLQQEEEDRNINIIESSENEFDDADGAEEEEEDEEKQTELRSSAAVMAKGKGRSRYQCSSCRKVFRSYQALGGHRAAHKKINCCSRAVSTAAQIAGDSTEQNAESETKIHQCPVCFRVFRSGQALGGHKRSHVMNSNGDTITLIPPSPLVATTGNFSSSTPTPAATAATTTSISNVSASAIPVAAVKKLNERFFDLNLPASINDEFEMSAISEA